MDTTEVIKSILNPVRVLKPIEMMHVAKIVTREKGGYPPFDVYEIFYDLLTRYETITSLPLEKSMFVNPIEKPKAKPFNDMVQEEAYNEAKSKVFFAGFEKCKELEIENDVYMPNQPIGIDFDKNNPVLIFGRKETMVREIFSLFDFIYLIDRYNRPSTTKIEIEFTESFIHELLK